MERQLNTDVTERTSAEQALGDRQAWMSGQREALESALNGEPLESSLAVLVRTATDSLGEGTRAAFYLANGDGTTLHHVVGMPADYADAVDGFKIGADSLACGLATASGRPVLTADVMSEPLWEPWRDMARRFDYRGCWSFPIHTSMGKFIGTFALYWRQPREATSRELELASLVTHTASIIIARHQEARAREIAEHAQRESEARLTRALSDALILQRISTELISEQDPHALYSSMLDASQVVMGADAASIQTFDDETGELLLVAWHGFDPESARFWERVNSSSGSSCGRALAVGTRIVVEDVEANDSPGFRPFGADLDAYRRSGLRAVQTTPLVSRGGRHVGMISTHWRSPHVPTADDFARFDVLARQAADLLERARAEVAIRAGEERLRLALKAAQMGIWYWDIQHDLHRRDANLNAILGLPEVETQERFSQFLEHVHQQDRDRVKRGFDDSMTRECNLNLEFRIVQPDGTVRWLRDQGDVFGEGDGRYLAGACVDITDLKQLEFALRTADKRKDEFLAMLGHELRNPLAAIKGGVQLLQSDKVSEATRQKSLPIVASQVQYMERLIDDVLNVARIVQGKIDVKLESVTLQDVIKRALELVRDSAIVKSCDVRSRFSGEPIPVRADPIRLAQVISNLLSNAIKYSRECCSIDVDAQVAGDEALLRVRDYGIGIDAASLPEIFDLFVQVDHSSDHSDGGLGLGLAVVRRLVELHGGRVEALSEGEGKGSEFRIYLPLDRKFNESLAG